MGAVFRLSHKVGPKTHNERESAWMECGIDQFGDNVHKKQETIKYIRDIEVQYIWRAPEKTEVEGLDSVIFKIKFCS